MNKNTFIEQLKILVNEHSRTYTQILEHNQKYKELLKFINDNTPLLKDKFYTLKTKIFWILNDIHEFPKCRTCGNKLDKVNVFRLHEPSIYHYCSGKCRKNNETVKLHCKQNLLKKYGVENVFQLHDIKEKSKKTLLQKYGVDHYSKSDKWNEQVKESSLKHFGTEHPQQSKTIKDKTTQTTLKKYGKECYLQTDEFKEKNRQTCLKKYGVEYFTKTKEFERKMKQTKLKKYGDENYNNIEQIKQTSLKRYGVENPGATHESISKARRRLYYNNIWFASSPELAYYIWLTDNNVKFDFQPKNKVLEYSDKYNVKHRYYPDFYIYDENRLHEIKGLQHFRNFDKTKDMIWPNNPKKDYIAEAKHQCMIKNNVKILTNDDYKIYLKYCQKKFNSSQWFKQFKIKK